MPELPEVQTVVDTLRPRLLNARILTIRHLRRDILTPAGMDLPAVLQGRSFRSVERRAKRIVLTLDDGNRFYIHLGMSGRLTIAKPDDPLAPHTHLVIDVESATSAGEGSVSGGMSNGEPRRTDVRPSSPIHHSSTDIHHPPSAIRHAPSTQQLRFVDPRRFGGVWWMGLDADDPSLGPEPLTLGAADLGARLKKTRRPIKSALLDQSLIAGLGNIYVDESLFAARIHPLRPANKLSKEQIARLSDAIKRVLRRAINAKGSSLRDYVDADGHRGSFQKRHKVYDRADQPCVTCHRVI
jgi:formamidopyrimidine-DNA glycosylase